MKSLGEFGMKIEGFVNEVKKKEETW